MAGVGGGRGQGGAAASYDGAVSTSGGPPRPLPWLSRLRRITSSGGLVPEIDGLRFFAIAAVVLFHLREVAARPGAGWPGEGGASGVGAWLAAAARQGHVGVDLFFVISGFVLGLPFAAQHLLEGPPVALGRYYLRRLSRLAPPYALAMIGLFALRVLRGEEPARELAPHLLASLLYVHNVAYQDQSPINLVAWSLEVEVQFYLLAPLLARLFALRPPWLRRGLLLALAAAAVLLQRAYLPWMSRPACRPLPWPALTLLNYVQLFLLGFLLAEIYLVRWRREPPERPAWDLVSLLGWPALLLAFAWAPLRPLTPALVPTLLLALGLAAFQGPLTRRVLRAPALVVIGGMCYSIYLLHLPLLALVAAAARRLPPCATHPRQLLLLSALGVPVVLLGAGIYFVLIERPTMRPDWPRRLLRRLGGPPPTAGPPP